MPSRPPAAIGAPVGSIETPALVVDLDLFDANVKRMQSAATAAGVRLRPHGKAHKAPDIALAQIAAGASGICSQKISEAEAFVAAGIKDVLITNQVVDPAKLARLPALTSQARIGICADDPLHVTRLSEAFAGTGREIDLYVEINVVQGGGRCGVPVGPVMVALARMAAEAPGLRFAGLQAYHGRAQHLRTPAEREAAIGGAVSLVREARELLAAAGLPAPRVTGAGTGTYLLEAGSGVYDELQVGSYALMDADYARNEPGPAGHFAHALKLYATVISTAVPGQAVLDVGLKGVAVDSGLPFAEGMTVRGVSDEHCVVVPPADRQLALGDKVALIPGHIDPTCNLHNWFVGVRGGVVEALWPIAGRGGGL